MGTHIVMEGNAFYEVDEACALEKRKRDRSSHLPEKSEPDWGNKIESLPSGGEHGAEEE